MRRNELKSTAVKVSLSKAYLMIIIITKLLRITNNCHDIRPFYILADYAIVKIDKDDI